MTMRPISAPAELGQDRNVEHMDFIIAIVDIEPADRLACPFDDAVMRGIVVREVEIVLGIVLLRDDLMIKLRFSGLEQASEFPMPLGLVHAFEKGFVAGLRRSQGNVGGIDRRHKRHQTPD